MKARDNKFLADKLTQYQNGELHDQEKQIIEQWFEGKLNAAEPDILNNESEAVLLKAELAANINKAILKVNLTGKTPNVITIDNDIDFIDSTRTKPGVQIWLKIAAAVLVICSLSAYYVFKLNGVNTLPLVSYQTFTNPNGKVRKIELQDGTEIWMNAATQIRVAMNFKDTNLRSVYLDKGEAFFHVKRDTLRPFTITTGHLITTVLGTSFNIKSYPELHNYQVAVASGKVKVESLSNGKRLLLSGGLVKNDVLNYSLVKRSYSLSKEHTELLSSWKTDGSLYINQLSLSEIGAALARAYNIEVTLSHADQANRRYTMKINHEPIQVVLQQVARSTGMNYQLTSQKLLINPNPQTDDLKK